MKDKCLVLYHANCIDGITSAWVAWDALSKEDYDCDVAAVRYSDDLQAKIFTMLKAVEYTQLYVVDFSLPVYLLTKIEREYIYMDITVIDHHKTAFEMYAPAMEVEKYSALRTSLGNQTTVILDNNECGASLCWTYFHPSNTLPTLVRYVKDYDLWRFELGVMTKWFDKFLRTQPLEVENWGHLVKDAEIIELMNVYLTAGMKLQEEHEEQVALIADDIKPITIAGIKGAMVECPVEYTSDVGHEIARLTGTYGLMYRVNHDEGIIDWSLRSEKGCDVSAIAKKFGGGGHKTAAGFRTDLIPGSALLEIDDLALAVETE